MERVLVIGSNGAGKTTFSEKLSQKTGLPLVHIDKIYWRGCWEVTPRDTFETAVLAEAKKERWIIEGNNIRSLSQRLPYADTVFWFEFPPVVCTLHIIKRAIKYRNKARPDMPDQCINKLGVRFLRDAWRFNRKNRLTIQSLLEEAGDITMVRFTNRRQVRSYLQKI